MMREYARIREVRQPEGDSKKSEEKNKKAEIDYDITRDDLTDEYVVM